MHNNYLLKLCALVVLSASLLACQTFPKKTTEPTEETAGTDSKAGQDPAVKLTPFQQAIQSIQEEDIDKAIEQFQQIIKDTPEQKLVHTNLGLLYLHKKKLKEAEASFLTAISQDKNDAVAYNHLAIIQRQQGEFKKALYNYYNAINADNEYASAHLNLGILLDIYLQDLPKALEQYEIFQQLTDSTNEQVGKWVIDIKRRVDDGKAKKK